MAMYDPGDWAKAASDSWWSKTGMGDALKKILSEKNKQNILQIRANSSKVRSPVKTIPLYRPAEK